MNEEKEHILNKIANIVDFPEKEHESDEAIASEFYEFVQTMLDASAASNGTFMCVDTSIQTATYIYEKFLSILPKKNDDLNYKFINYLEMFSFKHINEPGSGSARYFENLVYPFILGHEEIVITATLIRDEVYKGAYGIKFIMDKTKREYYPRLVFNAKDKVKLFEESETNSI